MVRQRQASLDRTARIAAQWSSQGAGQWTEPDRHRRLQALGIVGRIQRVQADADVLLRPLFARAGLDDGAFDVLAALRRSGPPHALTPADLVEAMLVTGSAVTKRVDRLIAQGLVTRERCDIDGRSRVVALTPRGIAVADELIAAHLDNEADLLSALDSDQRDHLEELLAVLADSVERRRIRARCPD